MVTQAWLYFDGAARGNGTALYTSAYGYVLQDLQTGEVLTERSVFLGTNAFTSNAAEYKALIAGLRRARFLGVERINIVGDSKLVCNQVLGEFMVRNAKLRMYYDQVMDLLRCFECKTVMHVPRAQNARADGLANAAFSHDSEDYEWGRWVAMRICRRAKQAWSYLLNQRIHGIYRIKFLLGLIKVYYPSVYEQVCLWAWAMPHVDETLRNRGSVAYVLVTA